MENQTEKLRYKFKRRQHLRPGDVVALCSWGSLWQHYVIAGNGLYSPPPYCDDVVQFPVTYAENYKHMHEFIMHSDDLVAVLDPSQKDRVVWSNEKCDDEFNRWAAELFAEED